MSDVYDGSDGQPMPIHNDGPSMHDLVRDDLLERKAFGLRKYGTTLQAHNGRDPLKDLYDELLDAVVYTRQLIAERSFKVSQSSTEGFSEVSHIPVRAASCRVMETRSCPVSYENGCGDRPCARFESDDETPWLRESSDA